MIYLLFFYSMALAQFTKPRSSWGQGNSITSNSQSANTNQNNFGFNSNPNTINTNRNGIPIITTNTNNNNNWSGSGSNGNLFGLPTSCASQCKPIYDSIKSCPSFAQPQDLDQWKAVTTQIATCLCPIFKNPTSDVCGICIQSGPESNSSSTALYVKLKTDCTISNEAVQVDLLKLFGVSVPNVVGNNSATPADTPSEKKSMAQSLVCAESLLISLLFLMFY